MLAPGRCWLPRPNPSVVSTLLPAGGLPIGKNLADPAVAAMAKVAGQAMKVRAAERLTSRYTMT
jgi:hypothetical protein